MSVASQTRTIDQLAEKAAKALAKGRLFDAERAAVKALDLARDEDEFERIARIAVTLQEVRRLRIDAALDASSITILEESITEEMKVTPGCYLVRPPLVGADARRLRLLAFNQEVPVAVICREPRTQLGLCPIVAISGGGTVRTKVDPPHDPDQPDLNWFMDALDALGEAALETVDPQFDTIKRVNLLLARLESVPEYDGLLQCLAETCLEAHEAIEAQRQERPSSEAGS